MCTSPKTVTAEQKAQGTYFYVLYFCSEAMKYMLHLLKCLNFVVMALQKLTRSSDKEPKVFIYHVYVLVTLPSSFPVYQQLLTSPLCVHPLRLRWLSKRLKVFLSSN